MEKLRRYQLAHAEQVTEGMNRLAQALVCLTDPVAKKAYDAKLLSRKAKRRIVPTSFDVPSPSDEELPSPSPPRWLLLAWIVWLIIGLVGLGAVITYFPAIQASYHGEPRIRE
jgi:hypothetical protein